MMVLMILMVVMMMMIVKKKKKKKKKNNNNNNSNNGETIATATTVNSRENSILQPQHKNLSVQITAHYEIVLDLVFQPFFITNRPTFSRR